MKKNVVIVRIKTFVILGSYAANIAIYRSFGTTCRSNLQSSIFTLEEVTGRLPRNAVYLSKRAKLPFKQRRKPEVTHSTALWRSGSARPSCSGPSSHMSFYTPSFLGTFAKFRNVTWLLAASFPSVGVFVQSAWDNSAPTGRIFMKFDIWVFFENLFRKFQV